MTSSNLSPADARQMAAFVLGIDVTADEETALQAFRRLSAQHHPGNGGERELYGAVLGAWATWVRTTHAPPRVVVEEHVVEELGEVIDDAASARAATLRTDGLVVDDALQVIEEDELVIISLPEAALPAPHRAYLLTGDRSTLDPMRSATVLAYA